ncbi:MAG: nitroreductase family protein [Armatimonadota bacterium]
MSVAIDPVCLMEVNEAEPAATSVYQGRTYYFCAPGCKVAFDEDPERYLSQLEQAAAAATQRELPMGSDGAGTAVIPDADLASLTASLTMPVDVAIKTRRSVARLKPDPIPRRAVERLLDAAVWAPNHHLTEPWEFFVLTGDGGRRFAEIRKEFRRTLFPRPDAPEVQAALAKVAADTLATPVIIVVTTTNPADRDLRDDDYGATMCAIQNILLVATGLGLGTYLRTGQLIRFPPLLEFLSVPESRRIAGVIYVGYPAFIPERRRTPAAKKTQWLG